MSTEVSALPTQSFTCIEALATVNPRGTLRFLMQIAQNQRRLCAAWMNSVWHCDIKPLYNHPRRAQRTLRQQTNETASPIIRRSHRKGAQISSGRGLQIFISAICGRFACLVSYFPRTRRRKRITKKCVDMHGYLATGARFCANGQKKFTQRLLHNSIGDAARLSFHDVWCRRNWPGCTCISIIPVGSAPMLNPYRNGM